MNEAGLQHMSVLTAVEREKKNREKPVLRPFAVFCYEL